MRYAFLATYLLVSTLAGAGSPFGIQVLDDTSGQPIPMVTLETVHGLRYVSDSSGLVAFDEPGMLQRRVFFSISSPGYTFPKDNFGFAGLSLDTSPGATTTIKMVRINVAERLYRLTGQGIYRDTLLLGKDAPLSHPNLNGGVLAQGEVQMVSFQNKLLWVWGDTKRPAHPLSNVRGTAALSEPPGATGDTPSVGILFNYFTNDRDEPQPILSGKEPGSLHFDGMVTVKDMMGNEHVLCHYARTDSDHKTQEQGIAEWNTQLHEFERMIVLSADYTWQFPQGQATRVTDESGDHFYFASPFCNVRVAAMYEAMLTPGSYEALSYDEDKGVIRWQQTQPPMTREQEDKWATKKWIKRSEARCQLEVADNGRELTPTSGSVHWNAYRKAFILICTDDKGDVWYAECKKVDGPWHAAVRIATHNEHPFTSVVHHDLFDQKDGQIILLEGVVNDPNATRYDGNAIVYRLDLNDERLSDAHVK